MAKKRSVKVYGMSGYKYRETPTIMLKGQWLKEVGFGIGDYKIRAQMVAETREGW